MAYGGESDVNKWFPTTGPITDTFNGRHPTADIPIEKLKFWHVAIVVGAELVLIFFTFVFTYWWYRVLKKRDDNPRSWFKPKRPMDPDPFEDLKNNADLKRDSATSTLVDSQEGSGPRKESLEKP